MPAIYDTDRADTPAIHRPNDRACTPAIHRPNDHACTPTINRPTGRQALCLTTIITVAGTVLPPRQTAAILTTNSNLTITALPVAYRPLLLCLQLNQYLIALLPFYSITSKKKNCQKLLIELNEVNNSTKACYLRHSIDPDFN